jgi:hypothetical protein
MLSAASAAVSGSRFDLGLRAINNPTATTKTVAAAANHGHAWSRHRQQDRVTNRTHDELRMPVCLKPSIPAAFAMASVTAMRE